MFVSTVDLRRCIYLDICFEYQAGPLVQDVTVACDMQPDLICPLEDRARLIITSLMSLPYARTNEPRHNYRAEKYMYVLYINLLLQRHQYIQRSSSSSPLSPRSYHHVILRVQRGSRSVPKEGQDR